MKEAETDPNAKIYPCEDCGKLRSKNEGGTVFTVCDACWDKHYNKLLKRGEYSEGIPQ